MSANDGEGSGEVGDFGFEPRYNGWLGEPVGEEVERYVSLERGFTDDLPITVSTLNQRRS